MSGCAGHQEHVLHALTMVPGCAGWGQGGEGGGGVSWSGTVESNGPSACNDRLALILCCSSHLQLTTFAHANLQTGIQHIFMFVGTGH